MTIQSANRTFLNTSILNQVWWVGLAVALSVTRVFAAGPLNKSFRVDHGRPIVVVSQKSVLLLEFFKEPLADALVPHPETDIRHCRARYRYQSYDRATDSVTNGQGTVEEIYRTVQKSATASEVKDVGSRVGISAGDYHLWWSEGSAGSRSWLNYRTDAPIRFIQQPQQIAFESVDREQFRRYLASRNVQEFVAAGKTVQVVGPSVFFGDLPTDKPVSGRVESARVGDSAFELKLSGLATNQHYIIESSYDLKPGGWAPVQTFIAHEPDYEWLDQLGKNVNMMFYRIRQGPY
jgi:hypothetical protein